MKTAGILAGHIRTWNQIKYHAMKSYEYIFGNIDWYVAVWGSNTESEEGFLQFFNENNLSLKSLHYVTPNFSQKRYMSLQGRFYLISLASVARRKYELQNNILYDRVIFSRPDVILHYNKRSIERLSLPVPYIFNFSVSGDFIHADLNFPINTTGDVFFLTGSCAADLLGQFYLNNKLTFDHITPISLLQWEAHTATRKFFDKNSLMPYKYFNLEGNSIVFAEVTRPTTNFDKVFLEYSNYDITKEYRNYDYVWDRRVRSIKNFYLSKYGIDQFDYGKW